MTEATADAASLQGKCQEQRNECELLHGRLQCAESARKEAEAAASAARQQSGAHHAELQSVTTALHKVDKLDARIHVQQRAIALSFDMAALDLLILAG